MNRFDKAVIVLFVLATLWVVVRQSFPAYDPEAGRRPLPLSPPGAAAPREPPAERVRRPPLGDPGPLDPIFTVNAEAPKGGSVLLGTAFSVDQRGLWITARHVASEICQQLVMVVNGRATTATMAFVHPQSDITVLRTFEGTPALPLATGRPTIGETGFSFGFPTGVLGATEDTLMGRSREVHEGRFSGTTPTLTWAEMKRFPDSLTTLGGMSGGPMFNADGRVVGSVIASTIRRGRVFTASPELLRQIEHDTSLFATPPTPPPAGEVGDSADQLSDVAKALSGNSRIAKVYCKAG
jgi:S1-C subfamily serine protease